MYQQEMTDVVRGPRGTQRLEGDPVSLSIPDPISAIARTFRRTGDRAYRVNLVGPFFGPLLSWHPSRNASSLPVLARGRVPPGHSWPLDCTDTSIENG